MYVHVPAYLRVRVKSLDLLILSRFREVYQYVIKITWALICLICLISTMFRPTVALGQGGAIP
jgi:hypothetical protein